MEVPKNPIHASAGTFLDSGKEIMAKQVLELADEEGISAEQKVERIRALVKAFIPQNISKGS